MPNEPITTKIITHKLTPWQIQNCDLYILLSGSAIELVILTGNGCHPYMNCGPVRSMDLLITVKGGKVKMFQQLKSQIRSVKKMNGSMKQIAMESKFHGPKELVVHLE